MTEFNTDQKTGETVVTLPTRRPDDLEFSLDTLLTHYVVIHGNGMIWDDMHGRLMRLEHLRASAGSKLVNHFLEDDRRRIVDMSQLVFEPGSDVDGINLFSGFQMRPDSGMDREAYQPLLDHLMHLCGHDDELYHWVLRWCAYPLQNLGDKMQTSIVMHGAEGTGKNLWWESVLDIYGEYGVIISQSEIESDFNGWASGKMFCIADEVISRAELRHMKGKLKGLITGSQIMINQKGQPQRPETNHMNMVFLSNEEQPIVLDSGDRRYAVIRCDKVKDPKYYTRIGWAKENGAIAGLYHYLMQLDLDGFNRHAKPPVSKARADLIDISKPSAERFLERWLRGDVGVPVQVCTSGDLYTTYKYWCRKNGERMPATNVRFGRIAGRAMRKKRVNISLDHWDGEPNAAQQKLTVYIPPELDDHDIGKKANQYRIAAAQYVTEVKKSTS